MPLDLTKITRARITQTKRSQGGYVIFPELYDGKWWPFVQNDSCLAVHVANMLGKISDDRAEKIKGEWEKWLKKWAHKNHLRIKIGEKQESARLEVVEGRKKRQPRWIREYLQWAKRNPDASHATPKSSLQWDYLKRVIRETGGKLAPKLGPSSDKIQPPPSLSPDSSTTPERAD